MRAVWPSLTKPVPLDTPRIGASLRVHLTNLPGDAAFVLLGFSDSVSRYGPLPFELTPVGMPGCRLHASDATFTFVTGQGGNATCVLPIPDANPLVGLRFYQQALVPDPGAGNALRAVTSEATAAIVGT